MLLARTHGINMDSWYRYRPMVLPTPMVLTEIHGIGSVVLNHTHTKGPSVTRMQECFLFSGIYEYSDNKIKITIGWLSNFR